ncbi:MAG: D-alanyl-D-alanine carboxypeptidase family protein [Ruminococcaceae bacterium]|nr:D-alanyl-D-alanine carboxypeptidase family protein [Oscillospiraceae bacterium]
MKRSDIETKPFIISLAIFIGAVIIAVAIGIVLRGCEKNKEIIYTTEDHTYMSDISAVKNVLNTTDEKYLILVNKNKTLGESYTPSGIIDVDTSYTLYEKAVQLEKATAQAAIAMIEEMRAQGISDVYITSGYRDYAYQKALFDNYVYEEWVKDNTLTQAECEQRALEYSAYPGTSEHQSGLCVDFFVAPGMSELVNYGSETEKTDDIGFAETKAFEWLKENSHKFGFILRYPDGKESVTGYSYESWHYRFVGVNAATHIYNNKQTLEQYLSDKK